MKTDWADLRPRATAAEFEMYPTARQVEVARKRRAIALRKAAGPAFRLRALTLQDAGASVLLSGYTATPQLGSIVANVRLDTGAELSTAVERSLIDGSPIGVRVTLVKPATRNREQIQWHIDDAERYAREQAEFEAASQNDANSPNVTRKGQT